MPSEDTSTRAPLLTPSSVPSSSDAGRHTPEKYLIAFVIQGDDVFKITADNVVHTTGTADGLAFDAIAKLKAAAALLELTNRHKERPDELRKMARELANEGMKLMAFASSPARTAAANAPTVPEHSAAENTSDDNSPATRAADTIPAAGRLRVVPEQPTQTVVMHAPLIERERRAGAAEAPPKPATGSIGTPAALGSQRITLISG